MSWMLFFEPYRVHMDTRTNLACKLLCEFLTKWYNYNDVSFGMLWPIDLNEHKCA